MDWMVDPKAWYRIRTHRSSYTSPVAPEKKNSRLYARAALERMQQAHRLSEILYLRQDEILEIGRVAHEGVGRGHGFAGLVEPGEALVAEPGGDLRAVAPRERVFVRDQHFVGLPDRRRDRLPVHGREAPQIDDFYAHAVLFLELLGRDERALHHGAVRHDGQGPSLTHALRFAERDREVGPWVGRLAVGLAIDALVLEEQDGIVAADRGPQQAVRIERGAGADHAQPWHGG